MTLCAGNCPLRGVAQALFLFAISNLGSSFADAAEPQFLRGEREGEKKWPIALGRGEREPISRPTPDPYILSTLKSPQVHRKPWAKRLRSLSLRKTLEALSDQLPPSYCAPRPLDQQCAVVVPTTCLGDAGKCIANHDYGRERERGSVCMCMCVCTPATGIAIPWDIFAFSYS